MDGNVEATIDWQQTSGKELKKGKDVLTRVLYIDYDEKKVRADYCTLNDVLNLCSAGRCLSQLTSR